MTPIAPDLTGVALDGRYELHAVIGEGTFGRVYRGRDRRLRRWVAVKVIKPWWAEGEEWVARFEREAQLMASVSDPGIVQIHDIGHAAEGLFYVAELVEGESLAERLKRGPLPPSEAAAVAEAIARALGRAHAQGVVHRDVKPGNVLLGADGRVKVGDFGVARLADGSSSGSAAGPGGSGGGATTLAGTPRYMAPEQARGGGIGPATDVYGVGVVLYEMLAGRPPFTGHTVVELALQHLDQVPPPLSGTVPEPLRAVVTQALAKAPSERPVNGQALADALAGARRALRSPSRPPSGAAADTLISSERPIRRDFRSGPRRRAAVASALVVAAVLAAMLAGALLLTRHRVRVPGLAGLERPAAERALRRANLRGRFAGRYSNSARGTVLGQQPAPGARLDAGTAVAVIFSDGPAPVPIPSLVGKSLSDAQAMLGAEHLRSASRTVAAPGTAPGTVTGQSPAAMTLRPVGATVSLRVAEVPRWRLLTRFAGTRSGSSVPFRIRGTQWRIVYSMSYRGGCTLFFLCSGPNATIGDAGGATIDHFSLAEGSGQTHTVHAAPGVYMVAVTPGSDDANWSLAIEDLY